MNTQKNSGQSKDQTKTSKGGTAKENKSQAERKPSESEDIERREEDQHESVDRPSSVSNPGSVPGVHPRA